MRLWPPTTEAVNPYSCGFRLQAEGTASPSQRFQAFCHGWRASTEGFPRGLTRHAPPPAK